MRVRDTEYRNVRLTEAAYQRLENRKRAGESFSDAVECIADERSLLNLAGILSDDEADAIREAIRSEKTRLASTSTALTDWMDP